MAITTNRAHVVRALDFFNKNDIYFAIGKSSPWLDDNNPPAPDPTATDLQEIIGFKKVENIYMVVPDEVNGTISYRDSKWRVVPPDQALQEVAKWVYIDTTIRYDELPLGYYRQIGVYTGLVKFQGTKEQATLTVTSGATSNGNLTITLNGIQTTVPVTNGMTAVQVADRIRTTAFNGWTVGGTAGTNAVTFTADTVGVRQDSSIQVGSTGVTATFVTNVQGQDPTPAEKTNLLPSEVQYNGRLEVLDNRQPANRQADQKEKLSLVIEF